MRVPALLLVLMTLPLSLTACAEKPTPSVAAVATKAPPAARKDAINAQLSARCPTPGQLQAWELDAVAALLGPSASPALVHLAGEYDRMDDEAAACRGGAR